MISKKSMIFILLLIPSICLGADLYRPYIYKTYQSTNDTFNSFTTSSEEMRNSGVTGSAGSKVGAGTITGVIPNSFQGNAQASTSGTFQKTGADTLAIGSVSGSGNISLSDTSYPCAVIAGHMYRIRINTSTSTMAGSLSIKIRNSGNNYPIQITTSITTPSISDTYFTSTTNDNLTVLCQVVSGSSCVISQVSLLEVALSSWQYAAANTSSNYIQVASSGITMVSSGASCIAIKQPSPSGYVNNYFLKYYIYLNGVGTGNAGNLVLKNSLYSVNVVGTSGIYTGKCLGSANDNVGLFSLEGATNNFGVIQADFYKYHRTLGGQKSSGIIRRY